ncbi:MAG TPA: amino acid ABC transporter permease [Acidimicrobiales bacterium]|nr:amino acid ABC transporter permease [Acidimicrobiales bacterium]
MATNGDDTIEVVPVRHAGRWVGSAVALLFIAMLVHTLFSKVPTGQRACHVVNGIKTCHPIVAWRFGWNVVFHYFGASEILRGLVITLELTVLSMLIGIVLGIFLAIMRLSHSRLLSGAAWSYTWFFRGTPVYVQLLFWGYFAILYPVLTIGLPFLHVTFLHLDANSVFSPFRAAMVALGLNEAAYMSEIARSGLISVDEGQIEAATSLGMTHAQTLRLVILPQAMRVIIPPTGNEVISMLKTTSLAVVVSLTELLGAAANIYGSNYQIMPLLIVASLWYLIATTILSIGQFYVERHFAKGALRTPPPTPMQRLSEDLKGIGSKFRTRRGASESGVRP